MKFELIRSMGKNFKDSKKEYIEFKLLFIPENVKETLELKELEEFRKNRESDGFYNDKWKDMKFIISLS